MKKSSFITFCLVSFSLAQVISIFGDRLNQFSVVGMIGKVEPGSSLELLKLAVFSHLPVLLFAPFFGSFIDRWRKGTVLVLSDVFRGVVVLMLPMLYMHFENLYAFYVPVMLLSMANLMFSPAKSSVIPEMVHKSKLMQVNALLWGIGIISTVSGFLFGGWFFDYHSWQLSFYTDGLSYLASVVLLIPLLFLPRSSHAREEGFHSLPLSELKRPQILFKSLARSIAQAVSLIKINKVIGVSLITQTSLLGLSGVLYVIGVGYVQEVSPPEKTMFLSIVLTCGTAGLLLGSIASGLNKGNLSGHHIISICAIVIGISMIGIAKSNTLLPLSIWAAALGLATSPVIVLTETLLQKHIPENFRGRVFTAREVLTKTSFLALAMLSTLSNALLSKSIILLSLGLFLALLGMLLERKKFGHLS